MKKIVGDRFIIVKIVFRPRNIINQQKALDLTYPTLLFSFLILLKCPNMDTFIGTLLSIKNIKIPCKNIKKI